MGPFFGAPFDELFEFASECHPEEKKPHKPHNFHAGFANWNIHKNDLQHRGDTHHNKHGSMCSMNLASLWLQHQPMVLVDLGPWTHWMPENAAWDMARVCNPAQLPSEIFRISGVDHKVPLAICSMYGIFTKFQHINEPKCR